MGIVLFCSYIEKFAHALSHKDVISETRLMLSVKLHHNTSIGQFVLRDGPSA